MAYQQLQYG